MADLPGIVWFRDDLRLADNPALAAAVRARGPVLCLYVLDGESAGVRPLGGAARWWLAGSLRALDRGLRGIGGRLVLRRGAAAGVVPALATEIGAGVVHWNRRYDAAGTAIDSKIAAASAKQGVDVETHQADLLFEPEGKPPRV